MIIRELDDGVVIRRLDAESAGTWRAAFTGAYQTIFSGHPYYERYYLDPATRASSDATTRSIAPIPSGTSPR